MKLFNRCVEQCFNSSLWWCSEENNESVSRSLFSSFVYHLYIFSFYRCIRKNVFFKKTFFFNLAWKFICSLFNDRYMIHLWDLNMESVWENRSVYIYYTELIFELLSLFIDFFHHLHMLVGTMWLVVFTFVLIIVCCKFDMIISQYFWRMLIYVNFLYKNTS